MEDSKEDSALYFKYLQVDGSGNIDLSALEVLVNIVFTTAWRLMLSMHLN